MCRLTFTRLTLPMRPTTSSTAGNGESFFAPTLRTRVFCDCLDAFPLQKRCKRAFPFIRGARGAPCPAVRIAAVAVVRRYNEIPPRSVIGQETYGNEVWEIVSEDGIVMIQATVLAWASRVPRHVPHRDSRCSGQPRALQAKVVEYNQRFVIKNALTEATTADFH